MPGPRSVLFGETQLFGAVWRLRTISGGLGLQVGAAVLWRFGASVPCSSITQSGTPTTRRASARRTATASVVAERVLLALRRRDPALAGGRSRRRRRAQSDALRSVGRGCGRSSDPLHPASNTRGPLRPSSAPPRWGRRTTQPGRCLGSARDVSPRRASASQGLRAPATVRSLGCGPHDRFGVCRQVSGQRATLRCGSVTR